jgi:uncharacterized protein
VRECAVSLVGKIRMPPLIVLAFLILAAAVAGFIDAAIGGGGLIQLPALLLAFPGAGVPALLGTNKLASCAGTTFAAAQFTRARILTWRDMLGPVCAAMAGSAAGVALVYAAQGRFDAYLRPLLLLMMAAILVFILVRPELGHLHAPRFGLRHQRAVAIAIALVMGCYDGFFGPGMGALLIFLFVALLGFDFLHASALAKAVNWASNIAALALFLSQGSWLPLVALAMAAANSLGGYLGARVALAKGNVWLRRLFIVVVALLIARLGWQLAR